MVTTKLLVDDKITACVKQICLLGCNTVRKVSNRKPLSGETFFFLEKRLLSIETLRSRFGHFAANNKLQVAVNGFMLPVCPCLGLKICGW